jgi:hypothetical protein
MRTTAGIGDSTLLWLSEVDGKSERDIATMFENAQYLPQSFARIRPRAGRRLDQDPGLVGLVEQS